MKARRGVEWSLSANEDATAASTHVRSRARRKLAVIASVLMLGFCNAAIADREAFELLTRNPADGALSDSLYNSDKPAITPDGRYVVFESSQTRLVSPATNGSTQIFLYDRKLNQTELISANAAGNPGNSSSSDASISADGCKVVFESDATNLVTGDVNGRKDVFLRQRCATPPQTLLVSLGGLGEQGANGSDEADISADGNHVVFSFGGSATTLEGLYARDLRTGVVQCISIKQSTGKCESARRPAISADGARVAFWSFTPLLSSDVNGVWDIYLYDRNAAAPISIVSVSATGQPRTQGNESTSRIVAPAISANGRYVAFATTSNSLVANDTNGFQDVFVKDTLTGNVIRASVSSNGAEGNNNSPIGQGERPSLSADGTWVVFSSSASNLTPRSASGSNIVAHNILTGQSIDFVPPSGFGIGSQTVISGDSLGRFVVFFASDSLDQRFSKSGIFVHDRTTHCLLNYAESVYPGLFAPATGSSQVLTPYTYRAYSNAYLGISVADDHVYYLVPTAGNGPSDLGPLTNYLDASGCR